MSDLNSSKPKPTLNQFFEKKQLSENTKKTYRNSVAIIKRATKYQPDDLGFLNRVVTFQSQIRRKQFDYSLNTIKGLYIVWYSIAKEFPSFCFRKTLTTLKHEMDKYNELASKHMAQNINHGDTWDYDDASEFVSSLPQTTYSEYLTKVIVALYVLQPPVRLDYDNMMVYNRYTTRLQNEEEENFCIFNNNMGFFFVLNDFKTKNTIGKFISRLIKPKTQLHNVLKFWFQNFNKSVYLLADENGKPIGPEAIGQRLRGAFQIHLGLQIGVRQLRRLYETKLIHSPAYVEMSLADKKEEHRQLLHSFEMGHAYGIQGHASLESDDEAS